MAGVWLVCFVLCGVCLVSRCCGGPVYAGGGFVACFVGRLGKFSCGMLLWVCWLGLYGGLGMGLFFTCCFGLGGWGFCWILLDFICLESHVGCVVCAMCSLYLWWVFTAWLFAFGVEWGVCF